MKIMSLSSIVNNIANLDEYLAIYIPKDSTFSFENIQVKKGAADTSKVGKITFTAPKNPTKSAQVNYPTSKLSVENARGLADVSIHERPLSSPNYSVVFESKLEPGKHYPGVRDTVHFQESNKHLYNTLSENPTFKASLESLYPGITKALTPGTRGAFLPTSPSKVGLTWHHNTYEPGIMELVPKKHHTASGAVQKTLHPDGKGGMQTWGGGRKK